MDLVTLIVKAVLGTCLFSIILWCAQSRNPRAAGIMLTFPALNGIALLTAESRDLPLMARAMMPMIALNGLLCATYILLQRRPLWCLPHVSRRMTRGVVLGGCLCLWGAAAQWVAPAVQAHLLSAGHILTFVGVYALGGIPLTLLLLWYPERHRVLVRQPFWSVIRTNTVRVGGMFLLIVLVILVARGGNAAWAGRLSALPLLPFYSLLALSSVSASEQPGVALLDQVGSTVLLGPLVAMAFAWGFIYYLSLLPLPRHTALSLAAGGLGLLGLWGLCGVTIWGMLGSAGALERCLRRHRRCAYRR